MHSLLRCELSGMAASVDDRSNKAIPRDDGSSGKRLVNGWFEWLVDVMRKSLGIPTTISDRRKHSGFICPVQKPDEPSILHQVCKKRGRKPCVGVRISARSHL